MDQLKSKDMDRLNKGYGWTQDVIDGPHIVILLEQKILLIHTYNLVNDYKHLIEFL